MNLNPRLVAIDGVGFTPIQLAVNGLLEYLSKKDEIIGGYAKHHVNYKAAYEEAAKNYADRLNADFERKSKIQRDDMLATEFILALLQSEILHE